MVAHRHINLETRLRVLAVVSRFKWQDIDYLSALTERFDLTVAWASEQHPGAIAHAIRSGLRLCPIGWTAKDGVKGVRSRLSEAILRTQPNVIHLLYDFHEHLVLLVKLLVDVRTLIVFECRDPLTILVNADAHSPYRRLERDALRLSDGQIFVSASVRSYYERLYDLNLTDTSILAPHGFAQRNIGAQSRKLSIDDGKTHLALVGTADPRPGHGYWYGEVIRQLAGIGFVVHSHFHEIPGVSLDVYKTLARELENYHFHPAVSFMDGTRLSQIISRYDLMGVFYNLDAPKNSVSAITAVCMPTKAVCGWFHGAIPVVCFPHYRGICEWINRFGIGFVVEGWEDLRSLRDNHAEMP